MLIKGVVKSNRAVAGVFPAENGRPEQQWQFFSLEVEDYTCGLISCQLRSDDAKYKEFVAAKSGSKSGAKPDADGPELEVLQDLTGHAIKAVVTKCVSTGRTVRQRVIDSAQEKGVGVAEQKVFVGRFQITAIEDLKEPKYDVA